MERVKPVALKALSQYQDFPQRPPEDKKKGIEPIRLEGEIPDIEHEKVVTTDAEDSTLLEEEGYLAKSFLEWAKGTDFS